MTIDDYSLLPTPELRDAIAHHLAQDLMHWWLNESVTLPLSMLPIVQQDLTQAHITAPVILSELLNAPGRSHCDAIPLWINELRDQVARDRQLECTQQGVNVLGPERGKITQFLTTITPKIDRYRTDNFQQPSFDENQHGYFLKNLYRNRDSWLQNGKQFLDAEVTRMISDRSRGQRFATVWIRTMSQFLTTVTASFRHDRDKIWIPKEVNAQRQYEYAFAEIANLQDKFAICKEAQMEEYWEDATNGLQGMMIATLHLRALAVGLSVVVRLQEHLLLLEARIHRYRQCMIQSRKIFHDAAQQFTYRAEILALQDNPRFDRQDFNAQYQRVLDRIAEPEVDCVRDPNRLDRIYHSLTEQILNQARILLKTSRHLPVLHLFDLTDIPAAHELQLRNLIMLEIGLALRTPDGSLLAPPIDADQNPLSRVRITLETVAIPATRW